MTDEERLIRESPAYLQRENARLEAENAALREIVQAVAALTLWWADGFSYRLHCVMCRETIDVPDYMEDAKSALARATAAFRHAPDCPQVKARALLSRASAQEEEA
jgi:hypothetical protein